jgi:hypothetical protein
MKQKHKSEVEVDRYKEDIINTIKKNGIEESTFEYKKVEHNYTIWERIKKVFSIT